MSPILIAAILGLIITAAGAPYLSRYLAFRKRESLDTKELYCLFDVSETMDIERFVKALSIISDCYYKVHLGKLRPTDQLSKELANIDSFQLGSGSEKLEELLKEYQEELSDDMTLKTVVILLSRTI